MSYYRAAGDYYGGRGRGDLLGLFKKGLSIFGGPIGGAVSAALPSRLPPVVTAPFSTGMKIGQGAMDTAFGTGGKKRRSMNPGNAKALKRAIRREDAFLNLAKRALHGRYAITAHRRAAPSKRAR